MVMVPVPRYLMTDVYRFIVTAEESRAKATDDEQASLGPEKPEEWRYSYAWSEDDLTDVLEKGTRAVKVILPYLAKYPDERVKGHKLAELVYGHGARMQQLGGALGSFTKTAHKRYGRYKWPFEAIYNDEERAWEYRMHSKTAEAVKKLTGQEPYVT